MSNNGESTKLHDALSGVGFQIVAIPFVLWDLAGEVVGKVAETLRK